MAFTSLSSSGENLLTYVLRRDEVAQRKGCHDGHSPSYQEAIAQIAERELDAAGQGPKSPHYHFSAREARLLSARLKQLTGQLGTVAGKPAAVVSQVQKFLDEQSVIRDDSTQVAA